MSTLYQLHEKLEKYIDGADTGPAQRTEAWYKIKSVTVGGSEMAAVLNIGKYSSPGKLILDKITTREKLGIVEDDSTPLFTTRVQDGKVVFDNDETHKEYHDRMCINVKLTPTASNKVYAYGHEAQGREADRLAHMARVDASTAAQAGIDGFNGNTFTRWGTMLEEFTKTWAECLTNTKIRECGSLEGAVENQRYSPDGLGVAKINGQHKVVLYEFKSPFNRLPDGKIPEHYMPQVQTGMAGMDIVDCSVFCDNFYRVAPLDSVVPNNYSYNAELTTLPNEKYKSKNGRDKLCFVYAVSLALLYSNDRSVNAQTVVNRAKEIHLYDPVPKNWTQHLCDNCREYPQTYGDSIRIEECANAANADDGWHVNSKRCRYCKHPFPTADKYEKWWPQQGIIDVAQQPKSSALIDILGLYDSKKIFVEYGPTLVNPEIKNSPDLNRHFEMRDYSHDEYNHMQHLFRMHIDEFTARCVADGRTPVGFFVVKLLKSTNIVIEPNKRWVEIITEPMRRFCQVLQNVHKLKTVRDKLLYIIAQYPDALKNTEFGDAMARVGLSCILISKTKPTATRNRDNSFYDDDDDCGCESMPYITSSALTFTFDE